MGIHLRRPTKNDAVLIKHVDLAVGLDGAEYLRGYSTGIIDLVECDPLAAAVAAGALVEGECGVFSHVERLPRK